MASAFRTHRHKRNAGLHGCSRRASLPFVLLPTLYDVKSGSFGINLRGPEAVATLMPWLLGTLIQTEVPSALIPQAHS